MKMQNRKTSPARGMMWRNKNRRGERWRAPTRLQPDLDNYNINEVSKVCKRIVLHLYRAVIDIP